MIIFLGILGFVIAIAVSYFLYVEWGTHVEMSKFATQRSNKEKAWINFPDFIDKFKEKEWTVDARWPGSFFTKFDIDTCSHADKIHARMVIFDNKSYTFYPWSYVNFMLWERFQKKRVKEHVGK